MKPSTPKVGETRDERIVRKAGDLRAALIETGVVKSPEPELPFEDLPAHRKVRWIRLAEAYVEIFG